MRTQADHAEYDWHAGPSDDQIAAEMEADRCQQLAALEAEIGRAVIREAIIANAAAGLDDDEDAVDILYGSGISVSDLIAQWRKLHAEGTEGEKK